MLQAFIEAEEKIAEIRANALDLAREEVKDELEEARTESATAEAYIDDIRSELESVQSQYAAKLQVRPAPLGWRENSWFARAAYGLVLDQASERAAQALSRESKALHGRISTMERETAVKVRRWRREALSMQTLQPSAA
jgi:chromosome segregation ATPase